MKTKISKFIKGSLIIILGIGIPVFYHTNKKNIKYKIYNI